MRLFIFFILLYIPIFLFYFISLICINIFILDKHYINYEGLLIKAFDFSIYVYILWCFLSYLKIKGKKGK